MAEIEQSLKDSPAVKNTLFNHLAQIGGFNLRDTVKRVMATVISHEMSLGYNWEGKVGWKTKRWFCEEGFFKTSTCTVITKAIMKNANVTERAAAVQDQIKKWLSGASDRKGGRKRRQLETQACEEQVAKD